MYQTYAAVDLRRASGQLQQLDHVEQITVGATN